MAEKRLRDFEKSFLKEYVFPGTDAAVIFVVEGAQPVPEIQEILNRSHQQRWFPVEGGNKAKIPYYLAKDREDAFEREAKGWDHEHCDFCNASVRISELCWTTPSGDGILIFCKECYSKVPD